MQSCQSVSAGTIPCFLRSQELTQLMYERVIDRLSGSTFLLFALFIAFYAWRVAEFGLEVKKLWEMHEFYTELLDVPEVSLLSPHFRSNCD